MVEKIGPRTLWRAQTVGQEREGVGLPLPTRFRKRGLGGNKSRTGNQRKRDRSREKRDGAVEKKRGEGLQKIRIILLGHVFAKVFPVLLYAGLFLGCRLLARPHSAWYQSLIKPFFCLPAEGFCLLWVGLLALQGVSMALALMAKCGFRLKTEYAIQMIFVLFYVLFFFTFKSVFAPFLVNILMAMQAFVMFRKLKGISRAAAWFQLGVFAGLVYCLGVIYSVLLLN